MSRGVTEFAFIPLLAGANIEDPSTSAGTVWKECLATAEKQKGFQRLYWGRQIENPSVLEFLVDWDSVEDHHDFMASPAYAPFTKHLMSIVDGTVTVQHAHFTPHPPTSALNGTHSRVTEEATFYFPADISEADKSSWDKNARSFLKMLEQHAEGFKASMAGWVVEELEHSSVEGKGNAYMVVIGWGRVEDHMAFRDTKEFKENVGLLSAAKGAEVHHVKMQQR